MARKKAEKEKLDLHQFNKGYPKKSLKVGDRVDIFKIPYKANWKMGSGVVKKIVHMGEFSAYCEVLMDKKNTLEGHWIYLGKIFTGR